MATFGEYQSIPGLVATSTLASNQYYAVKFSTTAGQVKVAAAATDKVAGILQNDPAAGEAADVAFLGLCKAKASASVTLGAFLTVNSTGYVTDIGTTDDNRIVGVALEASATAGNIISVIAVPSNL